jgi:hypothetical protein
MLKLDTLTILLVLLALLLTGCGSILEGVAHGASEEEKNDWPGWTGNLQESNERFTVNYNRIDTPGPWMFMVDQVWRDVQTCVGIAAPDPHLIIEYMPLSQLPITDEGKQVFGYIIYKHRYIRLNDNDMWSANYSLRHEFVHYLLWYAGVPQRDLDTHNSPFYEGCQL